MTSSVEFDELLLRGEATVPAEGKGEAGVIGHPLPVVAMGSIPHIYRREDFLHRATPIESAPFEEPRSVLSHVKTETF